MFKVGDRVKVKNGNYEFIITKIGKNIVGKKLYLEKENSLIGFIEKELELAPFKFKDFRDGHIIEAYGFKWIYFNNSVTNDLGATFAVESFEDGKLLCTDFNDAEMKRHKVELKVTKITQAFTGIVEWEREE